MPPTATRLALIALALIAAAAACAAPPAPAQNSDSLTPPVSLSPPLRDIAGEPGERGIPSTPQLPTPHAPTARVTTVIDGDTIEVLIDGRTYTVRYIGIDTPETVAPNRPVQPYGKDAAAKNRDLILGQTVRLEKDVSETDRYGRLLRYVWLGDLMVNAELVRLGYAQAVTYPPDVKHEALFRQLQATARAAKRGLWSLPPTATPTPIPPAALTGPCAQGCATPPPGCDIKGNISSSGERIYHVPGCLDYNATKINPANGERWFCTEAEALANAWRKAKNCP